MAEKKYIPLDAAIAAIEAIPEGNWKTTRYTKAIEAIPAADVAEVRHGRWINERREGLSSFSAECNQCGKRTLAYFHYFYCPNCGVRCDL